MWNIIKISCDLIIYGIFYFRRKEFVLRGASIKAKQLIAPSVKSGTNIPLREVLKVKSLKDKGIKCGF